ncbi:MAG TPA: 23S rRNA (adenine(2030)-N(6))-methyltransferase RlmJ [Mizugakiibacter sp.]
MNYRHAFHAGNFADVFKHAVLLGLIEALQAKPAALCYLDTHAGSGRYLLGGEQARKTGEAAAGVLRLAAASGLPPLLQRYLGHVRALNEGEALDVYPGSPLLAARALRAQDRAVLCELHPEEAASLRALFRDDPRVHVHQRDGYAALKALLPPEEKRGLVLIDPPFETQESEFCTIENALTDAWKRWPNGVYAVWYPIKLHRHVLPFHRWLARSGMKNVWAGELLVHPDNTPLRLNGCGMAIVNAPWQFDRELAAILPVLARLLGQGGPGQQRLTRLAGEQA